MTDLRDISFYSLFLMQFSFLHIVHFCTLLLKMWIISIFPFYHTLFLITFGWLPSIPHSAVHFRKNITWWRRLQHAHRVSFDCVPKWVRQGYKTLWIPRCPQRVRADVPYLSRASLALHWSMWGTWLQLVLSILGLHNFIIRLHPWKTIHFCWK